MKFLSTLFEYNPRHSTAQPSSKAVAKERLKLALTYDRGGLAHGTIEQLREEIIELIAKHLAIHEEDIVIDFDRTIDHDKMIASVPLQVTTRPRAEAANAEADKNTRRRRRRGRRAAN
ncbi:Cell division topological specificity factor [Candidatus Entotheonellaceae bacterium PAL068K]